MIWDSPTTYTVLDGIAYAINPAGTIVVGDRAGLPVYWYRTAGGGWNAVGTALPLSCAGCTAGRANDVNDAGIIVGGSRVSTGKSKATVWRLDMSAVPTLVGSPVALSGLGAGSGGDNSSAAAITNTAPYVVVGAASSGSSVAVRWASPF
jgi:hypothetical protein